MEYLLTHSNPEWIEFPFNSKNYISFVPCNVLLNCIKIDIPDIQRESSASWVNELQNKIEEQYIINGLYDFGRLDIASLNDKLYLLNGQHRYVILKDPRYKDVTIEVKIYTCETKESMEQLFLNVNGSRPSILAESTSIQIFINRIRKFFTSNYGVYLSTAFNPHKPNINLDKLCEHLLDSKIIELYHQDFDTFIDKLNKLNRVYLYSSKQQQIIWKIKNFDKYLTKCRQKSPSNVFVLGIINNYKWVYQLSNGLHIQCNERVHINKHLRKLTWNKRNENDLNGVCYVCNSILDYDTFECGHIDSVHNGGETNITNLEPICRKCNNDMGTMNLEDYKTLFLKTCI